MVVEGEVDFFEKQKTFMLFFFLNSFPRHLI